MSRIAVFLSVLTVFLAPAGWVQAAQTEAAQSETAQSEAAQSGGVAPGFAVDAVEDKPDMPLADPAQEARARALFDRVLCPRCEGQTIGSSEAPIAKDLRRLVRDRIAAGDSDAEVVDYIAARYGDTIRTEPVFEPSTYGLWLGPLIILALGAIGVFTVFRRHDAARPALEPDES